VARADTGATLARAWGPDQAQADAAALGLAVARQQSRHALSRDIVAPGPDTSALAAAPDGDVEALLGQVKVFARGHGVTVTGAAADADPLLGPLGLWHGPVHLEPASTQERGRDAR
jgi:hypothetical protein